MRPLYTAKDVEALWKAGKNASAIPPDALLTPSARDLLKQGPGRGKAPGAAPGAASPWPPAPVVPDYEFKWEAGKDPRTPEEIQRFWTSAEVEALKARMVDIGQRMWRMGFVDGNGGNLTVRVGDALFVSTPTLISKGFMTVEDICLIDFEGKQLAGTRKRTSEALTHLAVYRRQPKAKACCHAHPVHATAFAVAGVQPPTCLIPEAEVFLGQIGMSEYQTPGTPANAEVVGEAAVEHNAILMVNHGVLTWGKDIEDAYWKMENTDAYCRTIWIASFLRGGQFAHISGAQAKELIQIRKSLGMDDPRDNLKECELCDAGSFRPGVVCAVPPREERETGGSEAAAADPAVEAVVKAVTDEIMKALQKS